MADINGRHYRSTVRLVCAIIRGPRPVGWGRLLMADINRTVGL